jgi:hypothetical protein
MDEFRQLMPRRMVFTQMSAAALIASALVLRSRQTVRDAINISYYAGLHATPLAISTPWMEFVCVSGVDDDFSTRPIEYSHLFVNFYTGVNQIKNKSNF